MAHKLTFIVYWRKVQPLHCGRCYRHFAAVAPAT
jgi:hypothetical protein